MENGETSTDVEPWPTDTAAMWSPDLGITRPEIRTLVVKTQRSRARAVAESRATTIDR